jgi:F0F1-type ATP synthase membrane subunit b/b'
MLYPLAPWIIAVALAGLVAVVQWRVMSKLHLKRLAAVRAKHQSAQQSVATLLQQARQQTAQVQQELAAAREAAKLGQTTARARAAADKSAARQRLNRMLDDGAEARPALPKDGFADTLPSMQFAASTTFGLLQRSSPRAM